LSKFILSLAYPANQKTIISYHLNQSINDNGALPASSTHDYNIPQRATTAPAMTPAPGTASLTPAPGVAVGLALLAADCPAAPAVEATLCALLATDAAEAVKGAATVAAMLSAEEAMERAVETWASPAVAARDCAEATTEEASVLYWLPMVAARDSADAATDCQSRLGYSAAASAAGTCSCQVWAEAAPVRRTMMDRFVICMMDVLILLMCVSVMVM
jgi:hypothetical protein